MLFKIIDPTSKSCASSALNIFATRPTNVAINNSLYNEILPLNSLDNPPYHFKISSNDGYLDLSKCFLKTQFKLLKLNTAGTAYRQIIATDNVSVNQALGSTFIQNIKVLINGREVFNSNSLYSYKAIMDIELSHTKETKNSYLQCAGYQEDNDSPDVSTSKGFLARKSPYTVSDTMEYISKLFIDLFNQDLYFLNNNEIDIEITPNSQNFNIVNRDAGTYKLTLESCKLYVKSLYLMDGLNLELAAKLVNEPARYSINRTEMKVLMVTAGRLQYVANIFQEQVPRRIVVGFVNYNAFNANETTSPFIFAHHSIKDISIQFNGKYLPNVKYSLDFPNNKYAAPFHDMYENLGMIGNDTNGIGLSEYKSRLCFFVFNLTNSQEVDGCFDLIKSGVTSVSVNFAEAVPAPGLAMIIYAEHEGMIIVDGNRVVTTDLTA